MPQPRALLDATLLPDGLVFLANCAEAYGNVSFNHICLTNYLKASHTVQLLLQESILTSRPSHIGYSTALFFCESDSQLNRNFAGFKSKL